MSNDIQQIVGKAWNFAQLLRDDGLSEAVEDKVHRGKFPKVTKRLGKSPPQYPDEGE